MTTLAKPRAIGTFVISHNFSVFVAVHFFLLLNMTAGKEPANSNQLTKLWIMKKKLPVAAKKREFYWTKTANKQKWFVFCCWYYTVCEWFKWFFMQFHSTITMTMAIYYHCLEHKIPENCVTVKHQSNDCFSPKKTITSILWIILFKLSIRFGILNEHPIFCALNMRRIRSQIRWIYDKWDMNTKGGLFLDNCVRNWNIIAQQLSNRQQKT